MSDRPVPSGEPGQPAGTPPQQAPAGGAQAPGLPPQPPGGAFGPVAGFGPPPGVPRQQPQPVTPRPVSQPVPLVPQPGQSGAVQSGPVPPGAVVPQPVQPGPQWQQQAGFPQPQSFGGTPDWAALAERNEKDAKRRRRLQLIGALTAVVVVAAAGAGFLFFKHGSDDNGKPTASGPSIGAVSASASGSAGPVSSASAPPAKGIDSPPTVGSLPAKKGTAALNLGAEAKQGTMPGFSGQVLKLPSGQDSFAQTSSQVVDVNKSFTVSARVLVDLPNGNRSAVSQGDGQYYSYSLGRANNNGRDLWYFKVQVPGGGSAVAWSKGDATVNQWVLLTGVYDDPSGQITLYVNGAPQSSAKSPGVPPSGANTLQIGRLSSNSQWSDPWHGAVADIQTWDQVLPEADIVKIVAGPSSPPATPPTASWLTG
ncbi:LamG-like jellyroll fold domain-containing protein [Kitasatospora sp. NPDC088351]|uniref:LamG domain-containing protein n=1 Tax=unclassified Kitasatospora TaxID=2633591 RepID=UPI003442778D